VKDTTTILKDANDIQQQFLPEKKPTLWRAIPTIEQFQMQWEHKRDSPKFKHFRGAIQKGLDKIRKYYSKFDEKPIYILALGMLQYHLIGLATDHTISSSTSLL
jgi:hypothetical protein